MTLEDCYNAALPFSMAAVDAERGQDLLAALGNYRRAISVIETNPQWQLASSQTHAGGIDGQILNALNLLLSHCRDRLEAVAIILTSEKGSGLRHDAQYPRQDSSMRHETQSFARSDNHLSSRSDPQRATSPVTRKKSPSPERRPRRGMKDTLRDRVVRITSNSSSSLPLATPPAEVQRRASDKSDGGDAHSASRAAMMAWTPAHNTSLVTTLRGPYGGPTAKAASRSQPALQHNELRAGSPPPRSHTPSPTFDSLEPRTRSRSSNARIIPSVEPPVAATTTTRAAQRPARGGGQLGSTSPRRGTAQSRPTTPDVNPALEKHTASSAAKVKRPAGAASRRTQGPPRGPARAPSPSKSPKAISGASAVAPAGASPVDAHSASHNGDADQDSLHGEGYEREQAALRRCKGIDPALGQTILNEIVVHGDEVHWADIAGLEAAKSALKEAVVYPFLRPDLFRGLREPARGMLLFGPPGTGKTMLARAVATESNSTFFSISSSSLTSKYLGESEKLVRALFTLAKELQPSIIFVDEIDSLLSARSDGGNEHETSRRLKTEFLIQWSSLAKAAAAREDTEAPRVLVLAATNLPWQIDEAARRRFVRRQYIPLPEPTTRREQIMSLLRAQTHALSPREILRLIELTDGYSGSDITALAKDAAMGPLRSLGEALLTTKMELIRPIGIEDFEASLKSVRPSVSRDGLQRYEEWNLEYGSQ